MNCLLVLYSAPILKAIRQLQIGDEDGIGVGVSATGGNEFGDGDKQTSSVFGRRKFFVFTEHCKLLVAGAVYIDEHAYRQVGGRRLQLDRDLRN